MKAARTWIFSVLVIGSVFSLRKLFRMRKVQSSSKKEELTISDLAGHYDLDGVSFDPEGKVSVSSDGRITDPFQYPTTPKKSA